MRRNILSPSSPRLGTVSGYDADLLAYFYPDSWPIFSTALTPVYGGGHLGIVDGQRMSNPVRLVRRL